MANKHILLIEMVKLPTANLAIQRCCMLRHLAHCQTKVLNKCVLYNWRFPCSIAFKQPHRRQAHTLSPTGHRLRSKSSCKSDPSKWFHGALMAQRGISTLQHPRCNLRTSERFPPKAMQGYLGTGFKQNLNEKKTTGTKVSLEV